MNKELNKDQLLESIIGIPTNLYLALKGRPAMLRHLRFANLCGLDGKNAMFSHFDTDVQLPSLNPYGGIESFKGLNFHLQRGFVWNAQQCSDLVKSVFRGVYIPPLHVYCTDNDSGRYEVIDGKQRLTAIYKFGTNQTPMFVDNTEIYFRDLPKRMQDIFATSLLLAIEIDAQEYPLTDKEKIQWFLFINHSGTAVQNVHIDKLEGLL